MPLGLKTKRDLCAGGLTSLIGVVAVVQGVSLGVGSLAQMGAGYMPLSVGLILIVLGPIVMLTADHDPDAVQEVGKPDWRGGVGIAAGILAFVVLGKSAGLVAASYGCVFISALGDRTSTLRGAAVLAAAVTAFGILLFHYLLRIPFPLFWW